MAKGHEYSTAKLDVQDTNIAGSRLDFWERLAASQKIRPE